MIQNSRKLSELNENWKAIVEGSEDAYANRHNNPVEIELKKLGEIISQNLDCKTPESKAKHDEAMKKYKELSARGKLEEGSVKENSLTSILKEIDRTVSLLNRICHLSGYDPNVPMYQRPQFNILPEYKAEHDKLTAHLDELKKKYGKIRDENDRISGRLQEGIEDIIDAPEKENGEVEKEEPEKEVEVDVVAVSSDDKPAEETSTKKSSNKNTPTSTKFSIKDTNSAPTVDVKKEQGVKSSGIKEYNATGKVVPETTSPVAREMGVGAGRKEVEKTDHGTKKEVELALPIKREEGVKAAPKTYMEGYKETISKSLQNIKESFSI